MSNLENLMLKDSLKDLVKDGSLKSSELDEIERDINQQASKIWDQICWANDPAEKSKLTAELNQLGENLQAVYAARAELYTK
jgi:predicted ribosome quality control (RQC) complex YloA/Tae2 family protein